MAKVRCHSILRISAIIFIAGIFNVSIVSASANNSIDVLIAKAKTSIGSTSENTGALVDQLQKLEPQFSESQREQYFHIKSVFLGFRSEYKTQILFTKSALEKVENPDIRASLLYNLSDAYTNVGEYENALTAMNEGIVLLPHVSNKNAKQDTLQSAVSLLNSMRAYDESLTYANRLNNLESGDESSAAKCLGQADQVEIYFLKGESSTARSILPKAIKTCDDVGVSVVTLILKTLAAIDLIDNRQFDLGIKSGQLALDAYNTNVDNSDYVTVLQDAMARAYFEQGNLKKAEYFAKEAFHRATTENVVVSIEKSCKTMAMILRKQGRFAEALIYYDTSLALKDKILDDQLHKNIAYQRVKFDSQDKLNQLSLLEQKNKILVVARQLEQRNNQILILLFAMVSVLVVILGASLLKTLRQKNFFRLSSQIDGLTQVSNRAHFMACSAELFKVKDRAMSVILLDMDNFKLINDTFGHPAGDWVLTTVSATVKSHLRKSDLIGRLGGEEFAICLPDSSELETVALAERCRMAIAAIDTNGCGYRFPITASFGVASRGVHDLQELDETLAAADKALYFSKTEGRNRVSTYQ